MKVIGTMKQAAMVVSMMTAALVLNGCADHEDVIGNSDTTTKGITLTLEATNGVVDPKGSRAILTEEDNYQNPWLWEENDKLLVVDTDGKALGTMTLKTGINSKLGKFEGTIKNLTNNQKVRLFYLGTDTNESRVKDGKIQFDFTKLKGTRADLKELCALNDTCTVKIIGTTARVPRLVSLKNAFAVAHFQVKGTENSTLGSEYKKLAIRGSNVWLTASVDSKSGEAKGEKPTGLRGQTARNIQFEKPTDATNNSYDVYMPLVPGETVVSFDLYTANSYSDDIVDEPAAPMTGATKEKSFIKNPKDPSGYSTFTVNAEGKKVRFTNGNLQYYLPIQLFSKTIKKTLKPNTLYYKGKDKPLVVSCDYTVQPGSYRFAPNQWVVVDPTGYTSSYFGEYTCVKGKDNKMYVSGKDNPLLDMFYFGYPEYPARVGKKGLTATGNTFEFLPTRNMNYQGSPQDWGTEYVKVDGKPTITLTKDEWNYLINDRRKFPSPSRFFAMAGVWLDMDGNGKVDRAIDIPGLAIFPDGMTEQEARSLFTSTTDEFTFNQNRSLDTSTLDRSLSLRAVTEAGCLFLPFPGYANGYDNKNISLVEQIGRHFNYWTSTADGAVISTNVKMLHYNYTMGGIPGPKPEWGGNAVRLDQEVK